MALVTQGSWNVSVTTGDGICGARLAVFRMPVEPRRRIRYGDGHGRMFPSSEAAWAWAREHGYLEEHRVPWCPRCRVRHRFISRRTGFCHRHGKFVEEL